MRLSMSPIRSRNIGDSLSRKTGRFCGRNEFTGEQKEFVAQFSDSLKRSDEIVSEADDFQV